MPWYFTPCHTYTPIHSVSGNGVQKYIFITEVWNVWGMNVFSKDIFIYMFFFLYGVQDFLNLYKGYMLIPDDWSEL